MTDIISCICGYRGAPVVEDGRTICPLCQGRVKSIELDLPDDGRPRRRRFRLPGEEEEEPEADQAAVPWPADASAAGSATRPDADDADGGLPDLDAAASITYRIPCPKGHVLDVREELLGQQVVCPDCNTFFVLRATDSLEYRKEQKRRQRIADERRAESWLKIAIWAAVIIGLSFIVMLILALNPDIWRRG